MCVYGTTVGLVGGGIVRSGLVGGARSVLVHCCRKFSIRLRSLPVWLMHNMIDNPCEFLAILAMANPHLLQLRGDPRHLLLTLSKALSHCVSSSHLPTALPQIVSV